MATVQPRFMRNTAILAKVETTYGQDAAPVGASNAMLVSNMSFTPLDATNVDRALVRPHFGASEQLVGIANVKLSFDVEVAGSGTAGVAPAWSPLLRACAFAEVVSVGSRVEYLPITDSQDSVTLYYFMAGALHKLLGARGTVTFKLGIGEKPVMSYAFTGLDGGRAAAAVPAGVLTPFKVPQVITDPNSGDITFGCTYAAGALTGGVAYPSRGLELNIANTVEHIALLGGEAVDITGREVAGSFQLALSAQQEVDQIAAVSANGLQSLGFVHGTQAGNRFLLHAPGVQLINPNHSDVQGRLLVGFDARFLPVAGNDEVRIVMN